jgi:hypothetical protein
MEMGLTFANLTAESGEGFLAKSLIGGGQKTGADAESCGTSVNGVSDCQAWDRLAIPEGVSQSPSGTAKDDPHPVPRKEHPAV